MRSNRLYWISWCIREQDGVIFKSEGQQDVLSFQPPATPVKDADWAEVGWRRASAAPLPAYTGGLPRARAPRYEDPVDATDEARRRRAVDAYRYPVECYERAFGMLRGDTWRCVSHSEREVLLGLNRGHTKSAMRTAAIKDVTAGLDDKRSELLGATAPATVLAFLFSELLVRQEVVSESVGVKLMDFHVRAATQDPAKVSTDLVRELLRRQVHYGRELRRVGPFDEPGRLPRAAIQAAWWRWRRVFGAPWSDIGEHINVLEMRAFLASVAWRLRAVDNVHSRGIHLLDSMVCLGALAKGRSASRRLGPILAKVNALLMAGSFCPILGYVRTEENPADAPSRGQGG